MPGDTLSIICAKNPDLGYSNWKEMRDANIAEINRVGREKMADIGVGEDVTREPCGLPGHSNNPNHLIVGGIHYDEPSVPTIYPGTTLFLKNKPEPPKEDDPPQQAEEEEDKPRPNEIHKGKWMGLEHQAPAPKLEIYTQGVPGTPDYTYSADPRGGTWSKLLAYSFSESVDSLEGAFSFTVENEEVDRKGTTVFDIIPIRSIIKIYEGDLNYPAFVGVIRRRHIGMSMDSGGPKRTITFSGKSIISCVAEYTVSLDVRIQGVTDAMAKTKDLETKLAIDNLTIKNFIISTWDYFHKVSMELSKSQTGISNIAVAEVISDFIGAVGDFVTVTGEEQKMRYNIAMVFFNQSNNSIADVWRNILPQSAYELFSYCDKADGKPKVMVRQVPYGDPDKGNYDWKNLDIYVISPISLTAYDLDQNDEEVYTAFASYIIGSAMSREFYMAVNQTGNDTLVRYDPEKVSIYGFRPLEMTFNGYDRRGNTRNEETIGLEEAIRSLNERAAYWYSRLDDMYSGSVTICTDFNNPETNPRVGCRAKFLGGEFYINRTDHAWNYGGTPTIKLTLSRGMMYDDNGKMRSGREEGVIKNVGKRFRELERENA
jgi:hypothetical protein